ALQVGIVVELLVDFISQRVGCVGAVSQSNGLGGVSVHANVEAVVRSRCAVVAGAESSQTDIGKIGSYIAFAVANGQTIRCVERRRITFDTSSVDGLS